MKLAIIGGGAWGTALAQVAAAGGKETLLWALEPEVVDSINDAHENSLYLSGVSLSDAIRATGDLGELDSCDAWLVVTPAQHTRSVLGQAADCSRPLILCSKGIEERSGMSALGTVVVLDAAPPPSAKMAAQGSASTLAFELSDGPQRIVVNCGGPGPLPTELPDELVQGLATTAAHSTLVLADTNSTNILPDGSLGKGVEDVTIDRSEDNDASRIEASHGLGGASGRR